MTARPGAGRLSYALLIVPVRQAGGTGCSGPGDDFRGLLAGVSGLVSRYERMTGDKVLALATSMGAGPDSIPPGSGRRRGRCCHHGQRGGLIREVAASCSTDSLLDRDVRTRGRAEAGHPHDGRLAAGAPRCWFESSILTASAVSILFTNSSLASASPHKHERNAADRIRKSRRSGCARGGGGRLLTDQ